MKSYMRKDSLIAGLQRAAALIPDGKRLAFLQKMEDQYASLYKATRRREDRQLINYQLDACSAQATPYQHGVKAGEPAVSVVIWSRDCDMCESTNRVYIPANIKAYDELYERVAEGAEGPFHLRIIPLHSMFEPYFRDRALEAHEDGHRHVIYS